MKAATLTVLAFAVAVALTCACGWGFAAGQRDTYRQLFHEAMEIQESTHKDLRKAYDEIKKSEAARVACLREMQDQWLSQHGGSR